MNRSNETPSEEFPPELQRAFEEYPRITASADFNRRVLDKVLQKQPPSRLAWLCDRLDEIFARPLLKLLGTTVLGVALAWLGASLLAAPATVHATSPAGDRPFPRTATMSDLPDFTGTKRLAAGSLLHWPPPADSIPAAPNLSVPRKNNPAAIAPERSSTWPDNTPSGV